MWPGGFWCRASSFLINHFDLFGMRQVWSNLKGEVATQLPFRVPILYRSIRHPLYLGWLMAFWITPTMSVGRLLFSALMTAYILIAIRFEERDPRKRFFGRAYAEYREKVPMLFPAWPAWWRKRAAKPKTRYVNHSILINISLRGKVARACHEQAARFFCCPFYHRDVYIPAPLIRCSLKITLYKC